MSSKSPSRIKVGDRVVCLATSAQLFDMGIMHPIVQQFAQGTVTEVGDGRTDVCFVGNVVYAIQTEHLAPAHDVGQEEVEDAVCTQIKKRRDAGRSKYGTTMERTDLTVLQWVQHAQEEAMDFSIYLEKLKRVLKEKGVE